MYAVVTGVRCKTIVKVVFVYTTTNSKTKNLDHQVFIKMTGGHCKVLIKVILVGIIIGEWDSRL